MPALGSGRPRRCVLLGGAHGRASGVPGRDRRGAVRAGAFGQRVRIGAARRLLETTDQPLSRVAATVGLGSPDTLYRIFHRHLGIPPGEYRARFAHN
ncbi:helix-turn-helix domain-containing protein [Nocardia sp. CC227C]|uniref:helix-turn-helix domain-containing protein n=1 Tax=Nocardia sp. CC227C TaxID=3044562 RepID=UPI00278BCF01|nr:helix-turn-helix domain-containing protein [Nocardia sp. CC227C]